MLLPNGWWKIFELSGLYRLWESEERDLSFPKSMTMEFTFASNEPCLKCRGDSMNAFNSLFSGRTSTSTRTAWPPWRTCRRSSALSTSTRPRGSSGKCELGTRPCLCLLTDPLKKISRCSLLKVICKECQVFLLNLYHLVWLKRPCSPLFSSQTFQSKLIVFSFNIFIDLVLSFAY